MVQDLDIAGVSHRQREDDALQTPGRIALMRLCRKRGTGTGRAPAFAEIAPSSARSQSPFSDRSYHFKNAEV
jgi:hypothetical protein